MRHKRGIFSKNACVLFRGREYQQWPGTNEVDIYVIRWNPFTQSSGPAAGIYESGTIWCRGDLNAASKKW